MCRNPAQTSAEPPRPLTSKSAWRHCNASARRLSTAVATAKAALVGTHDIAQLQGAGFMSTRNPLSDTIGYKDLLARVRRDTKALIKAGHAIDASNTWH